ncbi:MAG TPA: efflux transporter periplasmic adaptor subunit [Cyanobacteria bacterium UBA11162]|nr:efflux transporter periplasmic adaptor subunit [Cyanobacteria bacterium UBA11162]
MGLIAAGILAVAGTSYVVISTRPSQIDLDKLTVPVEVKNLSVRITANGTVQPVKTVNLSPKTSGRLVELRVEQGALVKQGQIIAVMDQKDLRSQFLKAQADLEQAQARLVDAQVSRPEEINQAQARLIQAQARLAEARIGNPNQINQEIAQVKTAESQLELAQARVQRYQQLAEDGAISQDRFQEIQTEARNAELRLIEAQQRLEQVRNTKDKTSPEIAQLEASVAEAEFALQQLKNGSSKPEIAQLQAAVKAAQAQLLAVRDQVEDTVIIAPFSGIITQKYATEGAFVNPTTSASSTASATSTSIVALATTEIEILAEVPEVDVGQIKLGQVVEITTDAFPDQVFQGRVRLIAPEAIEEQNVTWFQVRVKLETGQKELRSGMNVDLTFLGEPINNALVVPTVAIVTKEGETGVMIPNLENKPQFKSITIGPTINDKTQIIDGLKQGERVFIDLPENTMPPEDK